MRATFARGRVPGVLDFTFRYLCPPHACAAFT
jgi:hypothetical protein